jgi:hypothetical protein
MVAIRVSPSGAFQEVASGGAANVAVLVTPASIDVLGPAPDFQPISAELVVALVNTSAVPIVAELVVNTANNNAFGIGLRITFSTNGVLWTPLPGASLVDVDSAINRTHLVVMGAVSAVGNVQFRAEWTAFGDTGTWEILATESGSACLSAWPAS